MLAVYLRVEKQNTRSFNFRTVQSRELYIVPNMFFLGFDNLNLTVNTDMATVVKAMAQPDSGLEIRDRMWLKITIPNAFIGKIHLRTFCHYLATRF